MSQYWSDLVHSLTPYTPGEQPKVDNLVKLNTNENPYPPSPKVLEAISEANSFKLSRYPDPSASRLKKVLAAHHKLNTNNVFTANSSDEVLAHVFKALLKQSAPILMPDVSYGFYPVFCKLFEIEYQQIPLRDDFTLSLDDYPEKSGGVVFANPNAPTGLVLSRNQIEGFLQKHAQSVVVVDEAYVDFAEESAVALVNQYPNLLVTQTLSKSRSLAGLRVGFAFASPELIEGLDRVQNSFHPYSLGSLAQAGAIAAIEDTTYFEECCRKIITTRKMTTDLLEGLGFSVLPSAANFVFAKHRSAEASSLFSKLRERGIIVRYFSQERLKNHLRISIGTDEQMQQLVSALREILSDMD